MFHSYLYSLFFYLMISFSGQDINRGLVILLIRELKQHLDPARVERFMDRNLDFKSPLLNLHGWDQLKSFMQASALDS